MLTRQLPLPLPHRPDYLSAAFLPAQSNAPARSWLARTGAWPSGRLLLWGEAGVGKSHLLHRWARGVGAVILSGPGLRGLPGAPAAPVAVDDADAPAEEAALLHLLNAAAEAGLPVLLAARAPASAWGVRLADLASRVRAMAAVRLERPEDSLLDMLLARLLAGRGLVVSAPLQAWLRLHLPREPAGLREFVARLDRAALAQGSRRVKRWLVVQVLAGMDGCEVEQDDMLVTPRAVADAASPAAPVLV